MGLVNNSVVSASKPRREYLQAGGAILSLIAFSLAFGPRLSLIGEGSDKPEVRLGYFPNLTHAPALIGAANQTFAKSLPKYQFSSKIFNAGPEAMEALQAGAIDATYVGPGPALTTFVKTNGRALRILAGACQGGASLMCRKDLDLKSVADLDQRRVAVPELGGTQDISLRHFLHAANLAPREKGGTVEILPIKNPEILSLMKQGQIDAAWVPEPWASRLAIEAKAKTVAQEADLWPSHTFASTVLVASTKFIEEHPDAVSALVSDNREIISWIGKNPNEAKLVANREIGRLTSKPLKDGVVNSAWSHLTFSSAQDRTSLDSFTRAEQEAEYIPQDVAVDDRIWFRSREGTRQEVASSTR